LPAGLRLVIDNAIINAVKHGGANEIRLSAVSPPMVCKSRSTTTAPECPNKNASPSSNGSLADRPPPDLAPDWGWRWSPSKPSYPVAQRPSQSARWAARG
jgi:hypothetical protein